MSAFNRSSQPICKACGQPIRGSYITALDAIWHPEHFVCAGCGRPIDNARFNEHEGKPYHPECYRDLVAPRCDYCHRPLMGKYVIQEGKSYHPECFREHVAPRCAYCGKPLTDQYLVDHWGTKYCKAHQDQFPKCSFCGRLVPPQQQESAARLKESVRCPICRSTAIETGAEAQSILIQLRGWLSRQGVSLGNLQLHIELCDRARIAALMKRRAGTDMLGVTMSTSHTLNGQVVRNEVSGIAVLHGLPATLFRGVVVHELGHAWLVVQGVRDLPAWAEEGFCELLAYRFYSETATAESRYHAANIEKNPDPVYGEGFRRVRAIAETMGFERFVEAIRTTRRLPAV